MYGTVFPGKGVAGKRYLFVKYLPAHFYQEVERQADIMINMPPHDNVVKGFDYQKMETANFVQAWIIMELCTLGSLRKYAAQRTLSLSQKIDVMLQSLAGLKHIHRQNIIHRHITPPNIVVTGKEDTPTIKICDFSMSCHIDHMDEHSVREMSVDIGTPEYNAPELFDGDRPKYNAKVDVYSMGVTSLSLLDVEEGGWMMATTGKVARDVTD